MNESPTRQLSVGVWAIIITSLVLSTAAIMLHVMKVLNHFDDRASRYGVDVNYLQNQVMILRTDLTKLQSDIVRAKSLKEIKQLMGVQVAPPVAGEIKEITRAANPAEAVQLLEQSQRQGSYEDYQAVHPVSEQQKLEELFQASRALHQVYQDLAAELNGRFEIDGISPRLSESEINRLTRLLFTDAKSYEVLESSIDNTGQKASVKVRLTVTKDAFEDKEPTSSTKTVQLRAENDGRWWKVADDADGIARQNVVLTKMKDEAKECRLLLKKLRSGDYPTQEAFQKAWNALPLSINK